MDSIIKGFLCLSIEKVREELTYYTIKELEQKLIKNTTSYNIIIHPSEKKPIDSKKNKNQLP